MVTWRERGFTYLTVLFVLAVMGAGLALVGEVWETSAKREKEAQLLFVGHEYRKAIERYYLSGPQRQYPRSLADLLKDPRMSGTERYLRKLYADPITGKNEWGFVKGGDGGIAGVYSLSEQTPLKIAGFRVRDAPLEGMPKYSEWRFVHTAPPPPAAKRAALKPATGKNSK